ncbi:hypothetical protein A2276_05840 [candidate division WOR-1 bacterium RIFOXYA12_FULL_43_27]|uniref:Uncharacterized protein n=1 Tax=candidate division WOR-1 bacterium RIFOXYC2_FULL_46_14 TaxID=1802587 RepID=A0A1F4U3L0_UNCSA|nr:MAG: hypothetical protein A2276_05840 [candidate division WOR-1 bacterium RIFOXYA12_FULL_43_27]OGC20183.1 MAG: hypothetical protein A2292_03840 [candidate division WOR-1 bacterium RIFOXYB2_FULL_46_45]OGC32079.1 MAG: hypothetical protein A2232_07605 [candidate division WOR-1 bacterium RIFOXYA2_FULL_46_56]OGC39481.1 MAG: hypothetical protein A2438_07970 [candidate division WOR-1 bacterium RIFOXYC2_FULL_46_14]
MPRTLVIVPAYVVNDGSMNTTAEIVRTIGRGIISHLINFGIGAEIQTGLNSHCLKATNCFIRK